MNQPARQHPIDCERAVHAQTCGAHLALTQLRTRVRQQFAGAVHAEAMDLNLADDMLESFDMEPLNRWWKVVVTVPIALEVRARDVEEADEKGGALIEQALLDAADVHELDVRWQEREPEDVKPGRVDTDNP